jgi:putative phosphotransacetylase
MLPSPPLPHRAEVEHLVRRVLYERLGRKPPHVALAPNPLVVNVSARHCHLTPVAVEALFGKGRPLTPMKWLYQKGQYAAQEMVTLIGPRSRVISNLRILGPCRELNQVELALTDAIALGFEILEMKEGVIRAAPHVHMSPDDATFYGVKQGDYMKLRIGGPCATIFDRLLVRVHADFRLEVHIDTDEGNACALQSDTPVELLK